MAQTRDHSSGFGCGTTARTWNHGSRFRHRTPAQTQDPISRFGCGTTAPTWDPDSGFGCRLGYGTSSLDLDVGPRLRHGMPSLDSDAGPWLRPRTLAPDSDAGPHLGHGTQPRTNLMNWLHPRRSSHELHRDHERVVRAELSELKSPQNKPRCSPRSQLAAGQDAPPDKYFLTAGGQGQEVPAELEVP